MGVTEREKKTKAEDDFDPFAEDDEEDAEAAKEALKKKAEASKKGKKPPPIAKSLIIWEVKPYDAETDLDALGKYIIENFKMEGLDWKAEFKKEPVAFGIFKIIIGATVEDAKVSTDDVQEEIEDLEDVQSVDVVAFNKL